MPRCVAEIFKNVRAYCSQLSQMTADYCNKNANLLSANGYLYAPFRGEAPVPPASTSQIQLHSLQGLAISIN